MKKFIFVIISLCFLGCSKPTGYWQCNGVHTTNQEVVHTLYTVHTGRTVEDLREATRQYKCQDWSYVFYEEAE